MSESKVQMGPRVEEDVASDYRSFVKDKFNGTYKGKLGSAIEEALKLQMALYYLQRAKDLDSIESQDFIDNPGVDDRVRDYMAETGDEILEAAQFMLHPKYAIVSRESTGRGEAEPIQDVEWENVQGTIPGFDHPEKTLVNEEETDSDDADLEEIEKQLAELTNKVERLSKNN